MHANPGTQNTPSTSIPACQTVSAPRVCTRRESEQVARSYLIDLVPKHVTYAVGDCAYTHSDCV